MVLKYSIFQEKKTTSVCPLIRFNFICFCPATPHAQLINPGIGQL